MASTTAGSSQLRSGWADSNRCRYHWPDAWSKVQAGAERSKAATQLLGGAPSGRGVTPDVPVPVVTVPARRRVDEPRVLVGGVVGDPVDDHLEPEGVGLLDQLVELLQGAEEGVDVAVVADVVAEVDHG